MAMRHLNPSLDLHIFSYVADDPTISEEHWVDIIGIEAKAVVHKVRPDPADLVADLDHLIGAQGEAFGSTSIYAQRQIFQQAHAAGIKVMLDGQGADELLGGYEEYIAARLGSLLHQGKWWEAMRFLRNAARLPGVGALWLWLRAMDFLIPPHLQVPLRRWIKKDLIPPWLNAQWFNDHGVEPGHVGYTRGKDVLRESLHRTLVETSLPHLLRYEDRNSMTFSIESRVPFLTPALANFMFALPEEYLVAPDGTTKAVLRQAMRGIVPDTILDRKDKIGFATPEKDWLLRLRPWVEQILTSDTAMQIQAIDLKEVRRDWDEVVGGEKAI